MESQVKQAWERGAPGEPPMMIAYVDPEEIDPEEVDTHNHRMIIALRHVMNVLRGPGGFTAHRVRCAGLRLCIFHDMLYATEDPLSVKAKQIGLTRAELSRIASELRKQIGITAPWQRSEMTRNRNAEAARKKP